MKNPVESAAFPILLVFGLSLAGCTGGSTPPKIDVAKAADPAAQVTPANATTQSEPTGPITCGQTFSPIHEIQGIATQSPMRDQWIETEGVVTGNFITGLNGFYIQTPDAEADADPTTAQGLFVMRETKLEGLVRGARVRVRGKVIELGDRPPSLTALETETDGVEVCANANEEARLPNATVVKAQPNDWSALQGMRVQLPPMRLLGTEELSRFGSLTVAFGARQFVATELHAPGPEARALADENLSARVSLDDNRLDEYPNKLWFLPQMPAGKTGFRVGGLVSGIEGIVEHRFGKVRIQLEQPLHAIETPKRPDAYPPVPANQSRIVAMNLLNYWNGDGKGGGFPTERGARDAKELKQQMQKLLASLSTLRPDVAALMEVENDGEDEFSALAQLVVALNQSLGKSGDYAFVKSKSGKLGDDVIRVALIYRTSRATPVGEPAQLESTEFNTFARVPMAQSFRFKQGDQNIVTVIPNHFKSKGGCGEADVANQDQRDGQGCWNALRTTLARQLMEWAKSDPTQSGSDQVILVGDFNAYAKEDPMRLIKSQGFVDVIDQTYDTAIASAVNSVEIERPYSFVFDGMLGRLDHALATPSLAARVQSAGEWHINADEMDEFDYRMDSKRGEGRGDWFQVNAYRSSDHDPLVVDLK